MNCLFKGLAAATLIIGIARPASAAIVTYTITGTVLGGADSVGLFGTKADLTGESFTAIETFDTTKAQSSYSGSNQSGANGGSVANASGFASATLTIGTGSRSFTDYQSSLSNQAGGQFTSNIQSSASAANNNDLSFNIASSKLLADYTQANAITGLTDLWAGSYTLTDGNGALVVWANFEVNGLSIGKGLTTPGSLSAVPLPASMPMFGASLLALASLGFRAKRLCRVASRS